MLINQTIIKFQKTKVRELSGRCLEKPTKVSVCVQTYNHAAYIKQCLDGILMQQTNFEFEILLGEDASTDGTREICLEYSKKHPNKIRLFLHCRENNIPINGQPTGRFNFLYNISKANGEYLGLCEGDDYWSDPLKLQKQVDILESNAEVGIVISDMDLYHQESNHFDRAILKNGLAKINEDYPLLSHGYLCAASWVMRTEMVEKALPSLAMTTDAALILYYEIAARSKVHVLNEVTAVYRRNLNSASNQQSPQAAFEFLYAVVKDQKDFIERHSLSDAHSSSIGLGRTYLKVLRFALHVENQDFINECLAFFNQHPYNADLSWIINQNKRLKKAQKDLDTLHNSKLFKLQSAISRLLWFRK